MEILQCNIFSKNGINKGRPQSFYSMTLKFLAHLYDLKNIPLASYGVRQEQNDH